MAKRIIEDTSVRPPAFTYRGGLLSAHDSLHCDAVSIASLARKHGTPLYVYSGSTIAQRFRIFDAAFGENPHTVCYSVKANSNLSILTMLADLGAGFDVVSGGELERVLRVSKKASARVVFSGVGKTVPEIDLALRSGILMFNVESESELHAIAERAKHLKKHAGISFRVNPDVSADTHPYISTGLQQHKFGIPLNSARKLYREAAANKYLNVIGISSHIGSQINDVSPFGAAAARLADLVRTLKKGGIHIRYIDAGGGLGIPYTEPSNLRKFEAHAGDYARAITAPLAGLELHLILEPGRAIVGSTGALITRVVYRKSNNSKHFLVVDAAMNDLIRPSLYGAHHDIVPIDKPGRAKYATFDVTGPICETGDFFARNREMPPVKEGELIAILDAGAYGMSIASNYNTRPRAAEVLVTGRKAKLIRRRETIDDLLRNEL